MYKGLNALGQQEHAGYHSHSDNEEMMGGGGPDYHGEDGVSESYAGGGGYERSEKNEDRGYKANKEKKQGKGVEESDFDKLVQKESEKESQKKAGSEEEKDETKKTKVNEHLPPQFRNIELPNINAPSKKDLIKKELEDAIKSELIERK